MLLMLIWRIWHLRNKLSHGKDVPLVPATLEYLDNYYKSILLAGCFSSQDIIKGKMSLYAALKPYHAPKPPEVPWPAPNQGSVALSVDGSFHKEDGSAAIGMVLRDDKGEILMAAYRFIFHCNDPLEAELHAIMQGMALAIQHSHLPVVVQSDSSEAISCLTNGTLLHSAYGHIVLEIKFLLVEIRPGGELKITQHYST
ncbi:Alpha-amylase [Hordeum vulgare]|nr:Alpha-amylase [Hordeum vulgare]